MSKTKERWIAGLAALSLALIIFVYYLDSQASSKDDLSAEISAEDETSPPEQVSSFDSVGFIEEIEKEDKVLDAAVDDDRIYIAVFDDGTPRDGYARYVCEVARDFAEGDIDSRMISIIDAVASARDNDFKRLGKHQCEF